MEFNEKVLEIMNEIAANPTKPYVGLIVKTSGDDKNDIHNMWGIITKAKGKRFSITMENDKKYDNLDWDDNVKRIIANGEDIFLFDATSEHKKAIEKLRKKI